MEARKVKDNGGKKVWWIVFGEMTVIFLLIIIKYFSNIFGPAELEMVCLAIDWLCFEISFLLKSSYPNK